MKSIREQYPVFTYESFSIVREHSDIVIHSYYRAEPDIPFHSTITFKNISGTISAEGLEVFAFHIGMMEIFNYWKATCSPRIVIAAGRLTQEQLHWWHDLLIKGMGEYFYVNQMDFTATDFVTLESTGEKVFAPYQQFLKNQYLIPVGGGKDSAVTLELGKQHQLPMVGFVRNPHVSMTEVLRIARVTQTVTVDRQLDPVIYSLNERGFYNGHVPFSAAIACMSLLGAVVSDCAYILVSNERSSNESTVTYLDHEINHQYSKSYDFETKFRDYVQQYISPEIHYLSSLRPLCELQISRIFSGMSQYFPVIRSCNRGQKTNSWCCNCPKCLSTFILLYPFMKTAIDQIFPENLFEKESLSPILKTLIDPSVVRPFECVGTREETKIGLYLAIREYGSRPLPFVLQQAKDLYLNRELDLEERTSALLSSWDEHHYLPEIIEQIVRKQVT